MILRKKALLISVVTLSCLIVFLYVTSSAILTKGFAQVEQQDVSNNVLRVTGTMSEDLSALSGVAGDWAAWDETYSYIGGTNPDYIQRNIPDTSFTEIRINFMIFVDSSGRIVYERGIDLQSGKEIPVPESLHQHLSPGSPLLISNKNSSAQGTVLLPEGTLLIVSEPILDNARKAPVRGTMIWGRYLNDAEIERLAGVTHLSLAVHRFDDTQMPSDFQAARSLLSDEAPIFIQPLSENSIAGYALLDDIYGKPGLVLRMDMPREIYRQGKVTIRYFILSLLAIGLVFGVVTFSLLEKSVLSRLARLSDNVSRIGRSGNHSERVRMTGKDELTNLADNINGMLESLEQSQRELRKSEEKNRALLNAIPDLMFQFKKDGTIFNYKATKDDDLNFPPVVFLGKKVYEILPEDVARQTMYNIEQALQTGNTQIFQYQLAIKGSVRDYEARILVSGKDEVLTIVRDITERKKAEEAQKNELLLKEIHHRIKNNLQVISSLLYLQSKNIKDSDVLEMFKDSQNRVRSMALAHEKLYLSKDMEKIDFGGYVRDLTNYLFQSYRINSNAVKLSIDADSVLLSMDTAIPCGFIINELITNSLKHAFPRGKKGEINVNFHSDNNTLTLDISDNGVGIPKDLDLQDTDSLGLKLVTTLVEQIDGAIELNRAGGTEFKITFKE